MLFLFVEYWALDASQIGNLFLQSGAIELIQVWINLFIYYSILLIA
jgi:hypothetical protein